MYAASNVSKQYGGVRALDGVDIEIHPAEVQALLGANGAGKSTLMKILVGAERPTEGTLTLDDQPVRFANVAEAKAAGVSIVSQELSLFPELDVLENLFMLKEPTYGKMLLNRREMARLARPVLDTVGLKVALDRPVGSLRLGDQQLLEIARALLDEPRSLFLDEPTSALQAADTQRLLEVVRRLRDNGVAVVYVSHFLEDVFEVADTITVLRNGRAVVARQPRERTTISEVVKEMVGDAAGRAPRGARLERPDDSPARGSLRLIDASVKYLLAPFSLEAEPGEVVGLAGLDGSGATVVLDVVFGRRRLDGGTAVLPNGKAVPRSMAAAVRGGVAFVPADRKRLGLMLEKPIYENVTAVSSGPLRRVGMVLRRDRLISRAEDWRQRLSIKASSTRALANQLSGGNQQKVVFAKWLDADPQVVLLDDPSRGVDVGAKVEMHAIIAQVAAQQRVILITSSDLEELADVCDRVIVFFRGAAVGEMRGGQLSEHRLLEAINTGVVE